MAKILDKIPENDPLRIAEQKTKIDEIIDGYRRKFRTSELNAILERAVTAHNPPAVRGKPRRFYYVTQLKSSPPTFALFANKPGELPPSYLHYLANSLRDHFDLPGVPLRLMLRKGKNPYDDDKK